MTMVITVMMKMELGIEGIEENDDCEEVEVDGVMVGSRGLELP